jgi:peptidyl-tRNA hydrolase, PTH1 family
MIRLVAFLGNYGQEYAQNRHNVAWMICEAWDISAGLSWKRQCKGLVASAELGGERVFLLKPETYMNLSGESVSALMRFHKVEVGEILIVHDELELPFGTAGFKLGGGLGGHNGLRSVKAQLGTQDFLRFRFGIGRPEHDDIAGYVLSDFSKPEREAMETALPLAAKAIERCVTEGVEPAMKDCIKRKLI